jgi:hypothetical protein
MLVHSLEMPMLTDSTLFQQDFYESVIIPKSKPVANSQWIDWAYMESKHDPVFDRVIAACKGKHLRDILAFKKDWNNEVIAQFYALYTLRSMGTQENYIG